MKLLEDAKVKGLEDGKKLGRKEELENTKNVEKKAYENGWREGHEAGLEESKEEWEVKYDLAYTEGKEHGQLEERSNWVSNHGEGLCASLEVSTPRIRDDIDASTQATPRTNEMASQTNNNPERRCAALQTEPPDDVDFSTQTTPQTMETATQTLVEHPSTPPNAATSPLTTSTQSPSATSTSLTTTTTTFLPAPEQHQKPRKRRHSLPAQPTTLQPASQPPFAP